MSVITYGTELWSPNKEENKSINQILDNIIKRILMTPTSTPREALYIETSIKDITHYMKEKRINTLCRLEKTKNELIQAIMEIESDNSWTKRTLEIAKDLDIDTENHK